MKRRHFFKLLTAGIASMAVPVPAKKRKLEYWGNTNVVKWLSPNHWTSPDRNGDCFSKDAALKMANALDSSYKLSPMILSPRAYKQLIDMGYIKDTSIGFLPMNKNCFVK